MRRVTRWPILLGMAIWLSGCGAQKEAARESTPAPGAELRAFEADFKPSSLDPEPGTPAKASRPDSSAVADGPATDLLPAQVETALGFRVQVFSTTNIDEASAKKTELEEAIPHERVYLEYDPPAYKIRAGNFLTRHDADRFVRFLSDKGFVGAWTVPQRVLKNPPPLPPRPVEQKPDESKPTGSKPDESKPTGPKPAEPKAP